MVYLGAVLGVLAGASLPIKRLLQLSFISLLLGSIAACSGGAPDIASTLGLKSDNTQQVASAREGAKSMAFAPLVGVPAHVSNKLLAAVKSAARRKAIPVTDQTASAGYLVRGYLVATPETSGAKLSYIWDINNNRGARISRVIGNEFIKGRKTSDGWSLVNDKVIAKVADVSALKLHGWFRKAVNNDALKASPPTTRDHPKRISPIALQKEGTPADPLITGAVRKRSVSSLTLVKPVQGAPGDGRISLTNALRRELKKNGIALTNQQVAGGYVVQGQVKLEKSSNQGRQNVRIVWNVFDEKGHRVGTVSQKNAVPKGSLNGTWGPTAEAAASAAAKGIVKLLPSKR